MHIYVHKLCNTGKLYIYICVCVCVHVCVCMYAYVDNEVKQTETQHEIKLI